MSKKRNDVNTRGEAEFQPNDSPASPTHKEQAWLETTIGQNAWGIRKEKLLWMSDSRKNIPYTWVEHWWNKIRKPPWCSEVLENFSHQEESHCTCSFKRHHAPFMMRALRPWTWWQRFVSVLSPLIRLSADPGHMLEFTGRWPPSCRTSLPALRPVKIQLKFHTPH